MVSWGDLGGPARAIGGAISGAVQAAQGEDRVAFESAVIDLAAQPVEATGLVLGALVRTLLEEQHSDGLDGDDVRAVLTRCYTEAISWLPADSVRVEPLLAVLSSALGIHEPGITYVEVTGPAAQSEWADPELGGDRPVVQRAPTTVEYVRHAPLLLADLLSAGELTAGKLSTGKLSTGGQSLPRHLDAAFAEIARSEAMEMP